MADDSRTTRNTDGFATTDADDAKTRSSKTEIEHGTIVALPPAGYDLGAMIGRGGMGEVIAARDRRIGRDVALKRMRDPLPDATATNRFLREARIQARLDHRAIVPVHELGIDETGRPFFTMKQLAGRTLAEHLKDNGPIQPLLRAFVDVCLAIERAHEYGVVHRDLKPANIMLGDYGEVYVLDWGIARVLVEEERRDGGGDLDTLDTGTQTGAMLGTPGFMSPEQIRGEPVDGASDVYALGAILFEILAGEPLHPRGTEAIATTLATPQQSPAARVPDRAIAPELDGACFGALHELAAERPRAGTLARRVQRYLDGDRDLERRRELARELLGDARAALDAPEGRANSIGLAGRALALDPESREASELMAGLLFKAPQVLPAACEATLAAKDDRERRHRARLGAQLAVSVFAFLPFVALLSIRSWPYLIEFYALHAAIGAFMYYISRSRDLRGYLWIVMVASIAASILWSRIVGPFMLNPVMMCATLLGFASNPRVLKHAWTVVCWVVVAALLPLVLESVGAIEQTTTIVNHTLEIRSAMFDIRGNLEITALAAANVGVILFVALYAISANRLVYRAQREQTIQNWQLNQIVATAREAEATG
jgi:serine/threonine-protein kinase